MAFKQTLVLLMTVWLVSGQRPSFAGTKPIGFPIVEKPADALGNRFGDDTPLPIEARGDRDLVERISKMPVDQQPFWYINWKALEQNRKNPVTYEQRPSPFVEDLTQNAPAGSSGSSGNSGNSGLNSRFGSNNQNAVNSASNGQGNRKNYRNARSRY